MLKVVPLFFSLFLWVFLSHPSPPAWPPCQVQSTYLKVIYAAIGKVRWGSFIAEGLVLHTQVTIMHTSFKWGVCNWVLLKKKKKKNRSPQRLQIAGESTGLVCLVRGRTSRQLSPHWGWAGDVETPEPAQALCVCSLVSNHTCGLTTTRVRQSVRDNLRFSHLFVCHQTGYSRAFTAGHG